MIVLYSGILLVWFLIYGRARRRIAIPTKRKNTFFEYITEYLYQKLFKKIVLPKVGEELARLEPEKRRAELEKAYWTNKIRVIVILLFCGTLLCLMLSLSNKTNFLLEEGIRYPRNKAGEGKKDATVVAVWEKEKIEVPLQIEEQRYTEEELEVLYEEYLLALEKEILNENASFERIEKDMHFPQSLSGFPFTNEWECSDYSLINGDGSLGERRAEAKGEMVQITTTIRYFEWRRSYVFSILVYPKKLSFSEERRGRLIEAVQLAEEKSRYDSYLRLPSMLDGEELFWKEKIEDSSISLFFLFLAAAVIFYFFRDREVYQEARKRKEELQRDYPEIVSKLAMLLGAGMTLRKAFERIALTYLKNRKGQKKRYAYEEILILYHEIAGGISEIKAYESFGKRCNVQAYLKLSTLLTQNIQKGSMGLLQLLNEEAKEAFQMRKNSARKKGEEAGTKLLIPMTLLLMVVMVIIMVPAFLSFQI